MQQPTLTSVAEEFQQWRNTRKSPRGKTPKHLRHQAIALLEHHNITSVIEALRLNSSTLKSWQKKAITTQPNEFVVLPNEPAPVCDSGALQISVRSASGAEISISGQLSPAHIKVLMQSLQTQTGGWS